MSTNSAVSEETVQRFANGLRGCLIVPADSEYEKARRVANRAIDCHPAIIVRCAGREDVVRAIEFARTHDLVVAVRGGGHSFAGKSTCDDGMVIDLSLMKGVQVDPVRRTATAQGGATLGDVDQATQLHGLVTPLGTVPQTGIAGLTLGGGIGWILGEYGLSCDNLQSVEVVSADGRTLTASAGENEDLFWGVRGGGNFGVVTSFEYRLHPLTHVLAGTLVYRMEDVRPVLRFVREFTITAPDELIVYAGAGPIGLESKCSVYVCYCGDPEAGASVLAPLRRFGSPLTDSIRLIPYLDVQNLIFDSFFGRRMSTTDLEAMAISLYAKSGFFRDLSDELIDTMADGMTRAPSPTWFSFVELFHGEACRIAADATAFSHRERGYNLETPTLWQDPREAEESIEWLRGYWRAVAPFLSGDVYVNHLSYDDEERVRAAYGVNHGRLVELKNKYDPTNFFRMNQNIKPTV